MSRRYFVAGLLVIAVLAAALGCGSAPAQQQASQPPMVGQPQYSLDFGAIPTGVLTREFGIVDPAADVSPAFRAEVVWPRLASLMTMAILGTDWPHIQELDRLPADVDAMVHGTAYLNPNASKEIPAQWVTITFARDKFSIPSGFSGTTLQVDEMILHCPSQEEDAHLYVKSGSTWLHTTVPITYDDLERYVQEVERANAPD